MSVHDPCPAREKPQVHQAVRNLLEKMNIEVVETNGSCQGRCRLFHAAMAMFFPSTCFDLFGFRYMIFSGVQSRVDPDQRSGCNFLAVS